jgi:hypothetical protein
MGAESQPGDLVVQILPRPVGETRVDRLLEPQHPLTHAPGGGDHHHHRDLRLQQQHLDVADRGRLDRGRRDEREETRHIGQDLRRRLQRRLDLAAHCRQVERERAGSTLETLEEAVHVKAIAALGRHASSRRVRVRE